MGEKKRPISGTNVYIIGGKFGSSILGKIRLVTRRGVEITESLNDSLKVTLQNQIDKVVGKFILSDEDGNALPLIQTLLSGIKIKNSVKVATKTVSCPVRPVAIQGIATGSAYTALDCMGILTEVKVPKSGVILSATFWDLDDEGLQTDLLIFKERITQVADHDKYSPADFDTLDFVTEIAFFAFDDHDTMQLSEVNNIGKAYTAPHGKFWVQAIARGAQDIAAGSEPRFQLQILSDDPDWKAR